MSPIYKAILHGDRIEWVDSPPEWQNPISVQISPIEDHSASKERGLMMAESLQELAREGGLSSISDPIAWQRDLRIDRSLPQREV
jgi:hypothetical protein